MMRKFEPADYAKALEIHQENQLPGNCLPDLYVTDVRGEKILNPLFSIRAVCEAPDGRVAMMAFSKIQGELFLILDHRVGTPEERWQWLLEFKSWVAHEAWKQGLDQLTAFVPPDIEESFAKRLESMGFQRSPYIPWTLNL